MIKLGNKMRRIILLSENEIGQDDKLSDAIKNSIDLSYLDLHIASYIIVIKNNGKIRFLKARDIIPKNQDVFVENYHNCLNNTNMEIEHIYELNDLVANVSFRNSVVKIKIFEIDEILIQENKISYSGISVMNEETQRYTFFENEICCLEDVGLILDKKINNYIGEEPR